MYSARPYVVVKEVRGDRMGRGGKEKDMQARDQTQQVEGKGGWGEEEEE